MIENERNKILKKYKKKLAREIIRVHSVCIKSKKASAFLNGLIKKGKVKKMKLSKIAFEELCKKSKARFPRLLGNSANFELWQKFCAKNPIEFRGKMNGAEAILRLSKDGFAIALLNPAGIYKIYTF